MTQKKLQDFRHSLVTIKKHNWIYQTYYWLISFPVFYRAKRFLKYAVLGLVGTFADVLLIYILHNTFAFNYLWVTFISDFVKTFTNFNLHKRFVFKDFTKTFSIRNLYSFIRYYIINFSTVIIIFIMVIFFVEVLKLAPIFAKLLADLIMNLTRFSAHKSIVFERPGRLGK
jgi:putative flippase GtrA